jgi:O-antigen/teichoic acid export membrane protein
MDALDRPDLTFRANLVYIVGNIIGNIVLVFYFGWVGAAVATSGAAVLSIIATWWYSKSLFNPDFPFAEVMKQVLAALVMGIVVYPTSLVTTDLPRPYVLVQVVVGAAIYFFVLVSISINIRKQILRILPGSPRN